jgi:hypothetical protein
MVKPKPAQTAKCPDSVSNIKPGMKRNRAPDNIHKVNKAGQSDYSDQFRRSAESKANFKSIKHLIMVVNEVTKAG